MEVIKSIWDFLQNEILGMAWLNRLIGSLLNSLGLDTTEKIGGSIQFFICDMIKIMVLLGVLIFIISIFRAIFRPKGQRKFSADFTEYGQIFLPHYSER